MHRKCKKIRVQALQQCARVYDYRYVVVGYVLQHPLCDMLLIYLKCSCESDKKREKGVGISLSRTFSKKFNTFSECFAGVLKSINFTVTVGYVSTHADLKSFFKIRKVDLIMQTIVIQLIEDSTPYLIRFKSNPIKCRKLVLCLDLRECNFIINEIYTFRLIVIAPLGACIMPAGGGGIGTVGERGAIGGGGGHGGGGGGGGAGAAGSASCDVGDGVEIPDEPFVSVPVRVSNSIILFSRTLCLRAESCLCLFKAVSSSSTDLRVSKASA
ncbi:hypothetical protein ALC60_09067 [Trachymyrmex zeteki]|uniref:Uncharacterized protein n=1 Tax=Mycetomoellerius zeteki TaxID=64791 RepID=A0A151WVN0_9HYME|nr:hypothetical protein ALC60_09067 [Trachymyrmex zeteki]